MNKNRFITLPFLLTTTLLVGCNPTPKPQELINPNTEIGLFLINITPLSLPTLPSLANWSFDRNETNDTLTVSVVDTNAETIASDFLSLMETSNWQNVNNELSYKIEDVGYAFTDSLEDSKALVLFLSDSTTFYLSITSNFELDPITPPTPSRKEKYKARRETSILGDSCFKNGLTLKSPETTTVHIEKDMDYGGNAEKDFYQAEGGPTYWQMAQWWTPFNFVDAPYENVNGVHTYKNQSRTMEVDTTTGKFTMGLNAYEEYKEKFGGKRDPEASWSHFLIEQSFPNELQPNMSTIDNLFVEFDVTVNTCEYLDSGTPVGSDCGQLLFYLRLFNRVPSDSNPEEVGRNGAAMWFGVPVMDTRYKTVPEHIAGDVGFVGATNSLIYSIPSKEYMDKDGVVIGKTYHISLDVYDYIKEAFIYGVMNDYLPNCLWTNLFCSYMNFGLEIPGQYNISATIDNLDIYINPSEE